MHSFEGLPELPPGRHDVVASESPPIACGDLEGEALSIKVCIALPVLAPVLRHRLPPSLGSLDGHSMHIASTRDVGDQTKLK